MNHETIQEQSLIERYHQGRLPPEEEARFEEHFTSCPKCQEELEMARGFRLGMRALAAEEAARRVVGAGIFAWLARRSRRAQVGLVTGALLAAIALPTAWFAFENRHLRSTAETARNAGVDWQERYLNERQSKAQLEQRLAEVEQGSAGRSELEARLEEEIASNERQAEQLERLRQPLINTPIFILSTLRGEGQSSPTLNLKQHHDWLALAVDVDDDPRIESYRVTVFTIGGDRLWRREGLVPNDLETLMVTFPAGFFALGDYRLGVEALLADGETVDSGSYPFEVTGVKR